MPEIIEEEVKSKAGRGAWHSWSAFLFRPVDGSSLALFRVLFGALMFVEMLRFFALGWIRRYYIEPEFHFSYVSFIQPWPGWGMYVHMASLAVLALLISAGCFYRVASALFACGFAYLFLLDKANYLNHFYLISLISVLMVFMPAHRCWSVDNWRSGGAQMRRIPFWPLAILRAQIVLVYFFGGIAKLNADWMRGEPQRGWMEARDGMPLVGPWIGEEWFVQLITWGGIAVDLSVGFLLLGRRTFWSGVVLAVLFNVSNAVIFSIGIFPYFMIASIVVFGAPDWPGKYLEIGDAPRPGWERDFSGWARRWVPRLASVYLLAQALIPLRHWLYDSHVHWSEEGHRFSWHMMLRDKTGALEFIKVGEAGKRARIDPRRYLNERQIRKMSSRPDMIAQFARFLADEEERATGQRPRIEVISMASLNGRPSQPLVDPLVDLGSVEISPFKRADWIIPLKDAPGDQP